MRLKFTLCTFLLISVYSFSQELIWSESAKDTDFFNELNWKDTNTNNAPETGTIDPNKPINVNLKIENTNQLIIANGIISLGTGSLTLAKTSVKANAISGGKLIINSEGYLDLENENPLQDNIQIELNDGVGWVRTKKLDGDTINSNHINQIKINLQPAIHKDNLRLDNYYFGGTVIRSNDASTSPVSIFDATNLIGTATNLTTDIIYSGNNIPNNFNNKTTSFLLRKGFMITLAVEEDGTGKSKNYMAVEEDLSVNQLPNYLLNNISFIRIVPWNWTTKKGIGGNELGLHNGWFYRWNNNGESTLDTEYVPMSWGAGGANDDGDIALYQGKYKATNVLAFNESDNCNDQSGQYSNLCQTDVAVGFYKNLMKTGLRLVSPSGRENAPFGWLKEFHEKATAQDIRIDVIGVHWYDWGSNPQNSPNANPQTVFNRFKNYLQRVYDLYKLPIWITEFNANPNRTTSVNLEFMKLALPYLESLDYVERYAWFQPNSDVADYYDTNGNLTEVGNFYKNQISNPAIALNTYTADNNLDMYYTENPFQIENLLENGNFETGDLTGWDGSNLGILTNANANIYAGTTSGRILAQAGTIFQEVAIEASSTYDLSLYTKWFVSPTSPIEIQILNAVTDEKIASKMMTTATDWNLVELSFTVPENVSSIKFFVEKEASSPGWFIDNALLKKSSSSLSNSDFELESTLNVYPNPSKGLFTIKSNKPIQSYQVYDLQGRLIAHKKNINTLDVTLQLSNKAKGMYTLLIKDVQNHQSFRKLIIH
ncbi:T9SS type A sorting domain-containing protein [Polaribacter litorisediminis]|uniref:glycosyl hydrolase n=1 Tax=Polaribacter litorisediminis TaxID=1908341 RepID=UPI001CBEBACC|nr:glycosyl hydrolase [Polaribacter litorisediminis]UAM97979.1 T9SS type A sorting domain-containing protein [Polaribacter litorisediminis]